MRLDELHLGERATVVQVTGADEVSVRLLEMGLTPGASLELIGVAPLGDPVELSLRGYRLSLRKREAQLVDVERA